MGEVKSALNSEFLNRLDKSFSLLHLLTKNLIKIDRIVGRHLNLNLTAKPIEIRPEPAAAKHILDKICEDCSYELRPLRRALQSTSRTLC